MIPLQLDAEHVIEQTAKLYLDYDGENWHIASSSADGFPLDSNPEGAQCDNHCEGTERSDECSQLLAEADDAPMPTIRQLVPLIAEHLTGEEIRDAIADLVEELLGRMQ